MTPLAAFSSFAAFSPFAQGAIGLYTVILFLGTVALIALEAFHRKPRTIAALAAIGLVLYAMFQCISEIHSQTIFTDLMQTAVDALCRIPGILVICLLVAITVFEARLFRRNRTWESSHITAFSVKEAVDNLPVGICCYESSGQVMLKNRAMEEFCRACTGEALLNADALLQSLRLRGGSARGDAQPENDAKEKAHTAATTQPTASATQPTTQHTTQPANDAIVELDDGRVFSLSDAEFSPQAPGLRILTATDITEQYKSTQLLAAQQAQVAKLNEELVEYGKQIVSSITAREVLNAKVKLHDELGSALLASKRYIVSGGTAIDRAAIENALHRSLQYLRYGTELAAKDEFDVIMETAERLGMEIRVIGNLTERESRRHIIVTGIHECLTNTIRHAHGNTLTVRLGETDDALIAVFTNNGKQPQGELEERGGLAMLRTLTEQIGGTMTLQADPQFVLTLQLPKEE